MGLLICGGGCENGRHNSGCFFPHPGAVGGGGGRGLACGAPGASLRRVALSPVPRSQALTWSSRTDRRPRSWLVHTPHPAWSWEPGVGEPRNLRFSLDAEAATGGASESGVRGPPAPQRRLPVAHLPCLAPLASPSPCSPPCLQACGCWTALPGPGFQAVLLFPFPLLPDSLSCHATPSSSCRHAIAQLLPSRSFHSLRSP